MRKPIAQDRLDRIVDLVVFNCEEYLTLSYALHTGRMLASDFNLEMDRLLEIAARLIPEEKEPIRIKKDEHELGGIGA